jgi:hypothetical protein
MHRDRSLRAALAVFTVFVPACDGGGSAASKAERAAAAERGPKEASSLAATVDGETIGIGEVRALMDEADAGLTSKQALDALIDEHLLAREAARRGFGGVDVDIERERAMAHSLVLKVGEETTVDSIEERTLKEEYERQRGRFVHGRERRVIHAVVLTGERGTKDPAAAEALAWRIREASDGAASDADFASRVKPFQEEAGGAVKVEQLPPFTAESHDLVKEFVAAAFAVPNVGQLSPVFRTSFGWHVLYLVEELPAQNVPFAEARQVLGEELLPRERQRRLDQLLERLTHDNPVFLYETPAAATE